MTPLRIRGALWAMAILGALIAVVVPDGAGAMPGATPTISFDRTTVHGGDRVIVKLTGWKTRVVTLSICGNLAKRGSIDCNLVDSQAIATEPEYAYALDEFTIAAPPFPCPCVVRGSSATQDEVTFLLITIVGFPTAPVVGLASAPPLAVTVSAHRAPGGVLDWFRALLGGPTRDRVTVTVANRTAATLANVTLAGSAGRGPNDQLLSFDLPPPGALPAGHTWHHTVTVRVPAPVWGRYVWHVVASGAGPPIEGAYAVRHVPPLLVVLVFILVADLTAMAVRFLGKRRRRRQEARRDVTHRAYRAADGTRLRGRLRSAAIRRPIRP